ncbi:uncharacterized protein BT62DRAFT_702005 [Guyanagaster necrorhizus]|uniref:Uncharacterized protein n=1 Tax=Guyanagaster necrorhizus TaxID=856835 RepID=A0A9P7VX67_9AGAR|nr:uncharacterized protein BT62DRAFT_702005 [Guyanagaster necrorhizus MCA 3950]KAG7448375.1 hypothetical protein BT62DRAFT_702005 [Guyanagaster necrorhizus MCA 3950]
MLGSILIYITCVVNCTQPLNLSAWTVASAALRHPSCSKIRSPLLCVLQLSSLVEPRKCNKSVWILLTLYCYFIRLCSGLRRLPASLWRNRYQVSSA